MHDAGLTVRRWTPEEDARLASLIADGRRSRQIAEALGRTRTAVLHRQEKLRAAAREAAPPTPEPVVEPEPTAPDRDGVKVDRLGRRTWSPGDVARLVEMRGQGPGHDEIATALGRTVDAVASRVHIVRLGGDDAIRPRKRASRWTPERVAKAHALAAEGLTVHQIALRVGAHAGGVARILSSPETAEDRPSVRVARTVSDLARATAEVERAEAELARARARKREAMEAFLVPVREAMREIGIIALPDPEGDDEDRPEDEAAWRLIDRLRRKGVELRRVS